MSAGPLVPGTGGGSVIVTEATDASSSMGVPLPSRVTIPNVPVDPVTVGFVIPVSVKLTPAWSAEMVAPWTVTT